jgi:ketosteroid isomerase-like protein
MEDAILVNDTGPVYGREAIAKYWVDVFKQVHPSNLILTTDQRSLHTIGTAGNEMLATGGYNETIQNQNFGPTHIVGYWSVIGGGDDWKIRMLTTNLAPAPTAGVGADGLTD